MQVNKIKIVVHLFNKLFINTIATKRVTILKTILARYYIEINEQPTKKPKMRHQEANINNAKNQDHYH